MTPKKEDKIKVWITKYALTQGIFEAFVTKSEYTPDMVVLKIPRSLDQYFHKGEWFEDPEEALKKFKEMKEKKINSLHKQMNKMLSLKPQIKVIK